MPIHGKPNYNRRHIPPPEWIAQAKGELPEGTIDKRCQTYFSERHDTFHCRNKVKRTKQYKKKLGSIIAKRSEKCQLCETDGHVYQDCPHIKYGSIKVMQALTMIDAHDDYAYVYEHNFWITYDG